MPQISGTMHLKIMKGVAKVPQDSQSSERGLDEIDLLDPNGFSCDEYLMKIPSMKSSAVYADSPLTDGRTLINGALGNVTETIRISLNGSTVIQMAAMLSKLGRFKQDCNDFWDTFGQIEPVYLKHQVVGEPGPRYALLYDIDIDVESPINPSDPSRTVTLSIEREFGWRGIAPGDNPKKWVIENVFDGQTFTSANANLLSGNDHILSATINNRTELNAVVTDYRTKNFVEIPAASIPGDLPALVSFSVQQAVSVTSTTLIVGKASKPTTGNLSRTTGNNQIPIYTFNASDGGVGTDTSLASDTGSPRSIGNVQNRSVTTFATVATMASRLGWPSSSSTYPNGFASAVHRGRYIAFLRTRVSAAASCNIQLAMSVGGQNNITTTPITFSDLGAGGTGNTTSWGVVYLGQINIPDGDRRTAISGDGRGIWTESGGVSDLNIAIQAERTSGAGSLYIGDLILIPIDEGALKIAASFAVGSGAVNLRSWNYDNTGYFTHGITGDFATIQQYAPGTSTWSEFDVPELSGSPIYLTPKVLNRLYFFMMINSTNRSAIDDPSASTVRVDIVPRWSGLRDA